ncbi:potassium transporter [Streptosporangium violaceochromogenes]|nr:potassium transporter [Streptosporangium violaceochromogenes]
MIGEIVGGLVLGPTLLGEFFPEAQHWLFPTTGPTAGVLGAFYNIGLLLLVYLTGTEMRMPGGGGERRTVGFMTASGLILPFTFGLIIARFVDTGQLVGSNGSPTTLALIFGMAVAVTSVPVISRIMLDLGILNTVFARMVLAVAVIEDILLYVILAIVLGLAQAQASDAYGLWALIGSDSMGLAVAYFTIAPLVFLAIFLRFGPALFARMTSSPLNVLERSSPVAFRLFFMFLLCVGCIGLGIDAIFGALVAGMCSSGPEREKEAKTQETLRQVSIGFFIPVYFAIVGIKLDLLHHFDLFFFCWFLVLACVVKFTSVWLGARLAGEDNPSAVNLAVAMNARGGPGIVLASTAFGAKIINESFFASLVLLSIITSQLAGFWLWKVIGRGGELRTDPRARQEATVEKGTPVAAQVARGGRKP